MQKNTFCACCGAIALSGMYGKMGDYYDVESFKEALEYEVKTSKHYGIVTLILNNTQEKYFGQTVRELGFKDVLGHWYNPVHPQADHYCVLYVLEHHPEKNRTKLEEDAKKKVEVEEPKPVKRMFSPGLTLKKTVKRVRRVRP